MDHTPGKRIQIWREYKGLTPAQMVRLTGIKRSTLDSVEDPNGSNPSFDTLSKLRTAFPDLSIDWLLGEDVPMLKDGRELTPVVVALPDASPALPQPSPAKGSTDEAKAYIARLIAEADELQSTLKAERKEHREFIKALMEQHQNGTEHMTRSLLFHEAQIIAYRKAVGDLNEKISEYELRLGYRTPTPEEAERLQATGDGTDRPQIKGFTGQRYANLLEAEATAQGGKQRFLVLEDEASDARLAA